MDARIEQEEAELVARVRGDLPATRGEAYLNNGTFGPLPRPCGEAMLEVTRGELAEGRIRPDYHERSHELREAVRAALALRLGADADEIALTSRTTEGLDIALWGLEWQRGEEIVTTRHEHPGLLMPLAALQRRTGARVTFADAPEPRSASGWLTAFQAARTPRTRAVALSHVLWTDGDVLPLARIAAWARSEGLLTIVDGAQAAGALEIDLHALGADFYALPGQKWLLGPDGTGALYVAAQRLALCQPTFTGYLSGTGLDAAAAHFQPAQGARRYEAGSLSRAQLAGLAASLRWQAALPEGWAARRIAALSRRLAEQLGAVPGVRVLTPTRAETAGLVSFQLSGHGSPELAEELGRRGFRVRHLPPQHDAVRVSCGFYTTDDELTGLARTVAGIAAGL